MWMRIISTVVLLRCTFCALSNFPITIDTNSSNIITTTMADINACYNGNLQTVVYIGNFVGVDINYFSAIEPISGILLNESIANFDNNTAGMLTSVKPQLLLINLNSQKKLEIILQNLRTTPWWNIRGLSIIFDFTTAHSCYNAYDYLRLMWNMDLLDSIFICFKPDNIVMLYTYNPYANYAPKPWKLVEQQTSENRPWTLYNQQFYANKTCWMLNFDKTQVFDGYNGIKAAGAYNDQQLLINSTEIYLKTLNDDDQQIANLLSQTLNITLIHESDADRGFVDAEGHAYGMLKKLVSGQYDIVLNSRYPAYAKGMKVSSVIAQSGLAIVSQPRGFLSIVTKISDFFKPWLFGVMFILCIFNAIVLKYSLKKRKFGTTLFEVIGLILDGSFLTLPSAVSARIFLIGIFLFIIIIQSLFRGRILTFLTKPIAERNMDTFEDLKLFQNYIIHCDLGMRKFVDIELQDRCLNSTLEISMADLLNNSLTTCIISDRLILIRFMTKYEAYWLHLSKHIVVKQYGVFMMRENWPLGDRISQGVSRLFESHLSALVYRYVYGNAIRKIKTIEENGLKQKFSGLKLDDLKFAFQALGIGLSCAILSFLVELRIWLIFYRLIKTYRRFLH